MTIQSKLPKLFILSISLIIFLLPAHLTLADNPNALTDEQVCVELSIRVDGDYMYGHGVSLTTYTGDGWVSRKSWFSAGQSVQLFSLTSGNFAFFGWFGNSAPTTQAHGGARVTVYYDGEAHLACDGDTAATMGIYDGRINSQFSHMVSSVYPASNGFDVFQYNPETGDGTLDFTVTRAEIEAKMAIANEVLEWQLVASGASGSFFAGSDGQCFIVSPNASGEMQTFSWTCA